MDTPDESTDLVRWLAEPDLQRPTIICAFSGWNDAGDAASQSAQTMIEHWNAMPIGELDPELFTDFATIRPHVRLDDEQHRRIVWPTAGVWSASLPGTDVIIVLGPEPSLRWRRYTDQIIGIAEKFGATMAITMGALLADVPHTRPAQLLITSSDPGLTERYSLEPSTYEGPTGIVGVLSTAFGNAGIPCVSLWAAVPNYANALPSPPATLALLERACQLVGSPRPTSSLSGQVGEYVASVDALVESNDLEDYVARLEDALGESPAEPDPSELVEEVERFLRDHDGDS
ncbi:filament polymerization regulator ParJ [soil metagenome]